MTTSKAPQIRIGVGSYTWPHAVEHGALTATDILERATENGLDCAQFCDNLPIESLRNLPETPLVIELGTRGLNSLEEWLGLAKALRSPLLRFVIDTDDHHPKTEEVIAFLRSFAPRLEAQNTVLAIENHDRFPALELVRMVRELDSPFIGICLDTANSLGAGEGIATILDALAPHTVCLHLKDITIRRVPNKMGFTVTGAKPGFGQIDFAEVWRRVTANDRCQSVILEQWPPDPDCENVWADAGISWLKNHAKSIKEQETS